MKRILITLAMTVTVTMAVFAQRGPGRAGGAVGQRGGEPAAALKSQLGLTDAQVTAIQGLIQGERTRMEAIRTEIEQKRQALDTLLNATSPSALEVGNAAIALHAAEAKVKGEQDYLIGQIKQQLTGEQQQKLDALIAANGGRGLLPGLGGGRGGRGGRGPR